MKDIKKKQYKKDKKIIKKIKLINKNNGMDIKVMLCRAKSSTNLETIFSM